MNLKRILSIAAIILQVYFLPMSAIYACTCFGPIPERLVVLNCETNQCSGFAVTCTKYDHKCLPGEVDKEVSQDNVVRLQKHIQTQEQTANGIYLAVIEDTYSVNEKARISGYQKISNSPSLNVISGMKANYTQAAEKLAALFESDRVSQLAQTKTQTVEDVASSLNPNYNKVIAGLVTFLLPIIALIVFIVWVRKKRYLAAVLTIIISFFIYVLFQAVLTPTTSCDCTPRDPEYSTKMQSELNTYISNAQQMGIVITKQE